MLRAPGQPQLRLHLGFLAMSRPVPPASAYSTQGIDLEGGKVDVVERLGRVGALLLLCWGEAWQRPAWQQPPVRRPHRVLLSTAPQANWQAHSCLLALTPPQLELGVSAAAPAGRGAGQGLPSGPPTAPSVDAAASTVALVLRPADQVGFGWLWPAAAAPASCGALQATVASLQVAAAGLGWV